MRQPFVPAAAHQHRNSRYAGQSMGAELRQIVTLLQARIQDAILLTARMDADEPVPAKYQRLVEEYYQALSDDLR